jgi:hypothetical protein
MTTTVYQALDIRSADRPNGNTKKPPLHLRGRAAVEFAEVALKHPIHRQACFAITSDILRHPVCWKKNKKTAPRAVTPEWVAAVVEEAVLSCLIMGYVAYKTIKDRLVIAPLCEIDLVWDGSSWAPTEAHRQWSISMVYPPSRFRAEDTGVARYNSPAFLAKANTESFDELQHNFCMRDHFNSRPSVFTTITKDLKNQNGSNRQWYQQTVAADSAANRQLDVDTSFHNLLTKRNDTVQMLGEATAHHRERLKLPTARKQTASYENKAQHGNMDHTEHILTDGRDAHVGRQLMSLADGEHTLTRYTHDIFFNYRVPPQVLGAFALFLWGSFQLWFHFYLQFCFGVHFRPQHQCGAHVHQPSAERAGDFDVFDHDASHPAHAGAHARHDRGRRRCVGV